MNIEKNKETLPTIDSISNKIEIWDNYTSVNIDKTISFCQDKFWNIENSLEICNSLDKNFRIALWEKNIDFDEILNTKLA